MVVDYNNIAKKFSNSRKNLKWEELDYFFKRLANKESISILDIGCGNWRLLWELLIKQIKIKRYLWIDLSIWLLEEAKKIYPEFDFLELDMIKVDKIKEKFDVIFLIATFHHLNSYEDRLKVLKKIYNLLNKWWIVFITNWALNSKFNSQKYENSKIDWSCNEFWSFDYNIKFWDYLRYYHCFDLKELNNLFNKSFFKIIENRLFDNSKNFISILKK